MKEEILPTCVKNFVCKAASETLRLDGRNFDEYRPIEVFFGREWGCCQVSFGETKVLAKATCDVQLPKSTRPNEGLLFVNVELSPMAAAHYELGQSDLGVHLNRLLEKFFKESRCVDLESLCIVAEEKVWNVRVDVNVLNSDGNLIGCCSAAVLAALMHFRRPDFTLSGEEVVIHSIAEQDPIPISLHHHPFAAAYAIFNNGEAVVADPTGTEERAAQAQLVMAVNTYRELCGLHLSGTALAAPQLILQYAQKSAKFAATVVDKIKAALEADLKARKEGPVAGLADCIHLDRVLASSFDRSTVRLGGARRPYRADTQMDSEELVDKEETEGNDDDIEIIYVGEHTAELKPARKKFIGEEMKQWEPSSHGNKWIVESKKDSSPDEEMPHQSLPDEVTDEDDSEDDVEVVKEITIEDRVVDNIELSGDSEEEDTMILKSSDVANS